MSKKGTNRAENDKKRKKDSSNSTDDQDDDPMDQLFKMIDDLPKEFQLKALEKLKANLTGHSEKCADETDHGQNSRRQKPAKRPKQSAKEKHKKLKEKENGTMVRKHKVSSASDETLAKVSDQSDQTEAVPDSPHTLVSHKTLKVSLVDIFRCGPPSKGLVFSKADKNSVPLDASQAENTTTEALVSNKTQKQTRVDVSQTEKVSKGEKASKVKKVSKAEKVSKVAKVSKAAKESKVKKVSEEEKTSKEESAHSADGEINCDDPDTDSNSDFVQVEKKPKRSYIKGHGKQEARCYVCDKLFSKHSHLKDHMKTHCGVLPFGCSVCGKMFSQRGNLDIHKRRHAGEKPFQCSECDYRAASKIDVKRHLTTHAVTKDFTCELCGKSYGDSKRLKYHQMSAHDRKVRAVCPECGFTTHTRDILNRHIKVKHTHSTKIVCPICQQTLTQKSTFQTHMRKHTGEKPFQCKVCDKTFSSNSTLAKHRFIHLEGQYQCKVCERKFKDKNHLARHAIIHTGMKPYSCHLCAYTANVKGNVTKHVHAVHKLKSFSFKEPFPKAADVVELDESAALNGEEIAQRIIEQLSAKTGQPLSIDELKLRIIQDVDPDQPDLVPVYEQLVNQEEVTDDSQQKKTDTENNYSQEESNLDNTEPSDSSQQKTSYILRVSKLKNNEVEMTLKPIDAGEESSDKGINEDYLITEAGECSEAGFSNDHSKLNNIEQDFEMEILPDIKQEIELKETNPEKTSIMDCQDSCEIVEPTSEGIHVVVEDEQFQLDLTPACELEVW